MEEPTQEQVYPEGLQPVGRPRAGTGMKCEEGGVQRGAVMDYLEPPFLIPVCPLGWGRQRIWGEGVRLSLGGKGVEWGMRAGRGVCEEKVVLSFDFLFLSILL